MVEPSTTLSRPGGAAVINPFDSEHEPCLVLVNDDDQHSLWPASVTVPDGWTVVHRDASRSGCLAYVEALWNVRRRLTAQPP
jgi:MbtH protein